uniref:Uncharacterized protein n=1 Tax=Amphimedon queenslandica TaxID=400682 RepID=A0A1X7TT17_AMPQE
MEIYGSQCVVEESTTQYSSEFVGGQIQVTPNEPSPERSEVHDQDELELDIIQEKFLLLDSLQVLKKNREEDKEESRRKIEKLEHLVAEKDEKLEQQSESVAELQMQKKINKVLILENEKFKSNIKEKEDRIAVIESELAQRLQDLKQLQHEVTQIGSAPEQIKTNIEVQHITESPSKQYVEGKDEICLKGLTLDNLESLVPLLLKTEAVNCLNIRSSRFEEPFTHHFSVLIANNLTLKCLLLTHDTINDEGVKKVTSESCKSLADLLHANKTLCVLSLSHTNIDVDGARLLVKSLESNDPLKSNDPPKPDDPFKLYDPPKPDDPPKPNVTLEWLVLDE